MMSLICGETYLVHIWSLWISILFGINRFIWILFILIIINLIPIIWIHQIMMRSVDRLFLCRNEQWRNSFQDFKMSNISWFFWNYHWKIKKNHKTLKWIENYGMDQCIPHSVLLIHAIKASIFVLHVIMINFKRKRANNPFTP